MDALKIKSRIFVIIVGSLGTLLHIYNFYSHTIGNSSHGIVLFKYIIQGEEYKFMKRSTQRSIYLQVFLFSINAVYTMFKDKEMKLMIFATGSIYRETGTASKEIEDKTFSMKIKRERSRSAGFDRRPSSSKRKLVQQKSFDTKLNQNKNVIVIIDQNNCVQNPLYAKT